MRPIREIPIWKSAAKTNQRPNAIRNLTQEQDVRRRAPRVKMNRLKNVPVSHADKTTGHAAAGAVVPSHNLESAQLWRRFIIPKKSTMFIRR